MYFFFLNQTTDFSQDDGIIVRTVKSRVSDRGDRNKKERGVGGTGGPTETQKSSINKSPPDDGGGRSQREERSGEISERERKRSERNEQRKAQRKEKRIRERENYKASIGQQGSDLNADAAVEKPAASDAMNKMEASPPIVVQKEEKVRKYSESRRERRASRNENRKGAEKADGGGTSADAVLLKVAQKLDEAKPKETAAEEQRRESFDSQQGSSSPDGGGADDDDNSRDHSKASRDLKRIRNKVFNKCLLIFLVEFTFFCCHRIVHLCRFTSRVVVVSVRMVEPVRIVRRKKLGQVNLMILM